MSVAKTHNYSLVHKALEVAIAGGRLPKSARTWGKTVLLEELALVIGLPRNTLRNFYYRDDTRLDVVLQSYVATSREHVIQGLRDLQFRSFSPVVWKRPPDQLLVSRQSLPAAVVLAQSAERILRETIDPPVDLRREVGTVAAEIMACALTFFDGDQRWQLLQQGEQMFLSAMAPLAFDHEVGEVDAALFAKFWENRATRCGLEWSNIWDDPNLRPTVGMDVVGLAIQELEHAAAWMRRYAGPVRRTDEAERLRQLLADKAKWLAKAGRFADAKRELAKLADFKTVAARSDTLLVQTLEHIADNRLEDAARSGGELAEMISHDSGETAVAAVTSTIMVHNIALLRGRRPPLPDRARQFLDESPVAASEMVNLPRFKLRLGALGQRNVHGPRSRRAS